MFRHQQLKRTVSITALSSILILWLAFPGCTEDKKKGNEPTCKQTDAFKFETISFRLALSQRNKTLTYPVFTITDNRYDPNLKNPSQQTGKYDLPSVNGKKPIKNGRLGNSLFKASLITLTALNIADYVSTTKALQLPGLEEANPIIRPFTKNILLFSAVKLGISALDFYLLKNVYKKNKPLGWVLSIAGNVAMAYIVSHNIHKIQAVSGK